MENDRKGITVMKTYLLYVRRFSFLSGSYQLYVYKVTTDNVYRIIGKIVVTSMEHIKRIDFNLWTPEREDFWVQRGCEIKNYKEPILSAERD